MKCKRVTKWLRARWATLVQAAHFTPSESEDASNGADNSMAKQQANVLEDIFSLAVRVAKRSDTVLAAVQTSVRHHLVT